MSDELSHALAARDWPKAERLLRRVVARAGAPASAHYNLGKVLFEQGKTAPAIMALRRAVATDPNHQAAWFELGRAALLVPDLSLAGAAFSKAALLDPQDADARINAARVALRRGLWQDALTHAEGAMSGDAALIRYRALAERGDKAAADALAALLSDRGRRADVLTAMTRTARGRIPLNLS